MFKSRSEVQLNLFVVVPGSTSRPAFVNTRLPSFSWDSQELLCSLLSVVSLFLLAVKSPTEWGSVN